MVFILYGAEKYPPLHWKPDCIISRERAAHLATMTVMEGDGDNRYGICVFQDISDRVHAERDLKTLPKSTNSVAERTVP